MNTSQKTTVIAVIAAVVLVGGVFLLVHASSSSSSSSAKTTSTTSQSSTPAASTPATVAATITYSSAGFSPALTTVKAGDTVKITNTDSEAMYLASDPHPTHTDDPDLNVGAINPGESKTFTVTQKGSYGFHNHLNPTEKGKIDIQ